jgi:hypothetical protein
LASIIYYLVIYLDTIDVMGMVDGNMKTNTEGVTAHKDINGNTVQSRLSDARMHVGMALTCLDYARMMHLTEWHPKRSEPVKSCRVCHSLIVAAKNMANFTTTVYHVQHDLLPSFYKPKEVEVTQAVRKFITADE